MDTKNARFKALLEEEYIFPAEFHFKFIVKNEQVDELKAVLNTDRLTIKPSRNNTYASVSARIKLSSSEEVLYVYEKVSEIEGIISL